MKSDESFGTIPLKYSNGKWYVFLIQHTHGYHWGFPKGHADPGEEPKDAAIRELREETHLLIVRYLNTKTYLEHYSFRHKGDLIEKTVTYYLVEADGNYSLQEDEIADGRWFTFENALKQLTFDGSRSILKEVIEDIS